MAVSTAIAITAAVPSQSHVSELQDSSTEALRQANAAWSAQLNQVHGQGVRWAVLPGQGSKT